MDLFKDTVAGNPVWAWFLSLGILVGTLFVLRGLRWMAWHLLQAHRRRTQSELAGTMADLARHTRLPFFFALGLQAAVLSLKLPRAASQAVSTFTLGVVFFQVGIWGSCLINHWIAQAEAKKRAERDAAAVTTLNVVAFLAKIVFWTILLLLALSNLGVNITALVTGLGIAGVAVALALQSIFGDLFASIAIAIDKPFMVGDFIEVGSFLGTVERIGLKTTRIRSLSGEEVVFSNADLLRQPIRDYKRMRERRVAFSLTLSYGVSYEKLAGVAKIAEEAVTAQRSTRFEWARLREYTELGPRFEVVYYVLDPDYRLFLEVHDAVLRQIFQRFEQEGLTFGQPARQVYLSLPRVGKGGPE